MQVILAIAIGRDRNAALTCTGTCSTIIFQSGTLLYYLNLDVEVIDLF